MPLDNTQYNDFGIFTLERLKLSPDALICGLSDLPMSAKEYIQWLN